MIIIRNIYILLKSRIQCLEFSTNLLLGYSGLRHGVCQLFPTFRKKYSFPVQNFKSIQGIINRQIRAANSFETSRSNYPTTLRIKPEDLLPQYENRFVVIKTFQRCHIDCGNAASSKHDAAISFIIVSFSVFIFFLHKRQEV